MRFSVVIPTMGRPEPLRRTLESLRDTNPCPDEAFVIDAATDASARQTALDFQDGKVPVRYIHTEPSLTRQRNMGIDEAAGDVIVFLDDDVKLPKNLFAKLNQTFADPTVVGATGWVQEPENDRAGGPHSFLRRLVVRGSRKHAGRFTRYGYPRYVVVGDGVRDVEFMPGCFMSVRREVAAASVSTSTSGPTRWPRTRTSPTACRVRDGWSTCQTSSSCTRRWASARSTRATWGDSW